MLWKLPTHYWVWGLSGKVSNTWERGKFIVEVSLPGPTHTLPGHPLIQCEAPATTLNGWGWLVVGQPKPFAYTSPAEIRLLLIKRERWIFYNHGVILNLIRWMGCTSIILACWSEPTLAIWSERLAKGPYQKNTPPAVGLEPAILKLQIQAFTNWTILAP